MGDLVINKKNGIIELFNTTPFCTVTKAELSRSILSDDYIDITVESTEKLDLNLEDRLIVEGRSYFVNLLPQVKKNAEDSFTHEIRFFGASSILRRNILFNRDSQGGKTGFDFPMTAELNAFLYLIINNANEFENNWILGNFPDNTITKTISFQKENCLAALQRVCQEFNVEFEVEETGGKFVLHIREKIGKLLPFTVEYGMGNGLYDLTRTRANDSEVVTILYGYGSSENIPLKYRGYSPRLRMPVAIGDYITSQAAQELFGKVVGVYDPDIKPEFKGVISGVGSLVNGLQEISVSNMDFDLKEKESDGKTTKYLIAGTPAKISVTKGNLSGYDFEINDYDHSTKTFKIKQFADERGQKFPDDTTVFKFSAGDEFTLIDIMMPEQYIINAEQKLYNETVKEYQKVSQNNVKYTLNVDPLFLQDKGEIGIGDLLPIKDADFGIDKASRIISLKKDLLTDTYTSFDVADSYEISLVKEIVNDIKDLQKEIASQKVINRQSYLDGYRRVEDRFSMYFDADGKMDGSHIKADTIDVGMLSSGSKSRWFQLEEVVFTPNLGSDPNSFRATAGRLVHFGIKTSSGAERVWNLSVLTVNNLLNQGYYVYAKCNINGDYGTFIITPERIVFDSQPNYYHFLIGNLYTASSGGRAFDANYGVSQMNGRMIFAGVISDIQGRPMIDLDKREIIGKVTFTNDSPALGQVQEKIDAVQVGARNLVFGTSQPRTLYTTSLNESYFEYDMVLLEPNSEYTISFYHAFDPTCKGMHVYVSFKNPDQIVLFKELPPTNSQWGQKQVFKFTTDGSTHALCKVFVYNMGSKDGANAGVAIKELKIEKGNKATDWTPAPEDIQKQVTTAQNSANLSLQKLADISNDNILTTSKKPDVVKEWQTIDIEYPKLIQQSNYYNVDNNIYRTFYSSLSSYLLSIQYDNFTIDTPINGSEFRQKFKEYYDGQADLLKRITEATKNYTNSTTEAAKVEMAKDALNKALAASYASGNCLYRDVDFRNGLNSLGLYNNSGPNTNPYLINFSNIYGAPTKSPQVAVWGFNANNQPTSPGYGGFFFSNQSRPNAVFVMRLIMRVPVGVNVEWAANQYGDGASFLWTTPTKGTGKFEEYICIARCGATGIFAGINYVWFNDFGFGNRAFEVIVAYASVFDMTDVDKYLEDRIKQNEQQTALAKAQADNALATANIASQKISFLSTTIDNNVVATGTLMVGDVVGARALITGVTDRGNKSVRFAAGTTYAGKETAPWNVLDDGTMNFFHPNGNLAFEFGLVNGKFVMNGYHESGFKIFELSPNRGLVNVAYIPESWTQQKMFNINQSSDVLDENAARNLIQNTIYVTNSGGGQIGRPVTYYYNLDPNYISYEYQNGTHPDNAQYAGNVGYKTTNNSRTSNIPNGWYGLDTGIIKRATSDAGQPLINISYALYYISNGKAVQTKIVTVTI
ncbi:hypothetical protein PF438_03965 [Elizabethkingia meningoseptica]|uniref:hypothetical protein n=1 Tax=Elizabethkingia meningoseptica TaxID=238 RepID=UPI0022F1B529|nr:hypothetical protein [Elizabethkingia meningoseptica]EJK5329802.1 hypothetical protein [Elizabethkingia meningoseptica]WBS75647.1 hypothetical protein PF438_03965 [Elizabethkingia meningoseptica]